MTIAVFSQVVCAFEKHSVITWNQKVVSGIMFGEILAQAVKSGPSLRTPLLFGWRSEVIKLDFSY